MYEHPPDPACSSSPLHLKGVNLPDRQALLLRYSGFSYAEIAGELGIRPPVVGTLLHRATEKLRKNAVKSIPQGGVIT